MHPNKKFNKSKMYFGKNEIINMNLRKMNTPEYISKDILEEEFVQCYRLVFYIQMALGSCRVHNKDRFVTSPTIYQKLYTILCIIVTVTSYVFIVKYYSYKYESNAAVFYIASAGMLGDLLVYVSNMIHIRFLNGDTNMMFFIKLQSLDRLMKIEHNPAILSMLRTLNMVTMLFFMVMIVAFLVLIICNCHDLEFLIIGVLYSQITNMIEIANCSNFIIFFLIRVRFLNSIISNHLDPDQPKQLPKVFFRVIPTKRWLRYMAAQTHDFATCDTQIYLQEIFDGFKNLQDVYKFQVGIYCVKLVAQCIITFEFVLYGVQNNILRVSEIVPVVTYSLAHFITTVLLSLRFEVFFREVKETKRLSIGVLMRYQEGPLRDKAKRMLKMIEESPPCFSVYDMWQMDAHTSLKLFSLITSLIVTLLQFAYL